MRQCHVTATRESSTHSSIQILSDWILPISCLWGARRCRGRGPGDVEGGIGAAGEEGCGREGRNGADEAEDETRAHHGAFWILPFSE